MNPDTARACWRAARPTTASWPAERLYAGLMQVMPGVSPAGADLKVGATDAAGPKADTGTSETGQSGYPSKTFEEAWQANCWPDHGWGGNKGTETDRVYIESYLKSRDTGRQADCRRLRARDSKRYENVHSALHRGGLQPARVAADGRGALPRANLRLAFNNAARLRRQGNSLSVRRWCDGRCGARNRLCR